MDKFSYAIGLGIGQNLWSMGAKGIVVEDFAQAIKDVLEGNQTAISHTEARDIVNKYFEEMEQKMTSDITLETFSSDGSQVSFTMRVSSKSAAANALMQLRTFESLATVTTTGLEEDEAGTVAMSVICTYANPAPLDNTEE